MYAILEQFFFFPVASRRRFGIIRAVGAGRASGGKPTANFNNFKPIMNNVFKYSNFHLRPSGDD